MRIYFPAPLLKLKVFLFSDTPHAQETHISEPAVTLSEEVVGGEVYNPSESGDVSVEVEEEESGDVSVEEEEEPIPPDSQLVTDSQVVVESSAKIEDVPKKSYASVVSSISQPPNFLFLHCPFATKICILSTLKYEHLEVFSGIDSADISRCNLG